jgi:hypothetical protein
MMGQPMMGQQMGQPMMGQQMGQPMMGQPMMGQPMMGQPMMGQQMGQPMMGQQMMGQTTTTTYVQVPQMYNRVNYQWQGYYDRRQPFMVPMGVDPMTAERMMYASEVFRMFDRDCNGVLTYDEFMIVMNYLNYFINPQESMRTFQMIDTNMSGTLDERELAAFFAYACMNGFNFDINRHRSMRPPITTYFAPRGMGMGMGGGMGMPMGGGMGMGGMPMGGMPMGGMGYGMHGSHKHMKKQHKHMKKAYKKGYMGGGYGGGMSHKQMKKAYKKGYMGGGY